MNRLGFLLPVPTTPPDEGVFHTCQFNEEWLPVVLEALVDLQFESAWDTPPADIVAQVSQLTAQIQEGIIIPPQIFPDRSRVFHDQSVVVSGANISETVNNASLFNAFWFQGAPVQGDKFNIVTYLAAGAYNFRAQWLRQTMCGIVTWKNAATTLGTVDMYGTTLANQFSDFHVTFPDDGLQFIRGEILSKNASSTGYRGSFTSFTFTPF